MTADLNFTLRCRPEQLKNSLAEAMRALDRVTGKKREERVLLCGDLAMQVSGQDLPDAEGLRKLLDELYRKGQRERAAASLSQLKPKRKRGKKS